MGDGSNVKADMVVLAACLGPRGQLLGRSFAVLSADTAATDLQLSRMQTPLEVHVTVPRGTDHLRFVVRDTATGRVGTVDAKP